jgi:hypothetical protein
VRVRGRHLDLRPASSLPLDELAALFNAGYEGYVIPFRLDEAALGSMITVFDIDRDASVVASRTANTWGLRTSRSEATRPGSAASEWSRGLAEGESAKRSCMRCTPQRPNAASQMCGSR